MKSPTVFISYSHDSPEHADRVLALADRLIAEGIDCILDQYETSPPEGWPKWMDRYIRDADFVVMICTETYYCRVMGEEEPGVGLGVKWEGKLIYQHICNADAKNTKFIPVLFKDGYVKHIPTPLQDATHYSVDTEQGYENLYRHLTNQPSPIKPKLGRLKTLPPRERKTDFITAELKGPEKVSLAKLPSTSPDLFGREKNLAMLDAAWNEPETNVVSLVAWGGVGKTALVNKWLLQLGVEDYRGAERVFGWSFYSQGAAEGRQVSADPFIAAALEWFGDPDPAKGSPWVKGERLAELVRQQRTLLIIDGLEPLQNPPPVEAGRIKDPGLYCLLRELAYQNPGLCIITTRLPVDDLKGFVGISVESIDLENLSAATGAKYLAHLGIKGTREELKQAAGDFGGHALALTLLGGYLRIVHQGDIRQRDKIAHLTDEKQQGGHARRVMESYENWFKGKPELSILCLMGLFNRPAEGGAIEVLKARPAIEGLSEELRGLSPADWGYAVDSLRNVGLLAGEDPCQPDTLDCHPLVREHFGEKLQASNPEAWKEAHSRLYEYYQSQAPEYPNTLEAMMPLYAAIGHGCQADHHREVWNKVFWRRIQRGKKQQFSLKKLGTVSSDLAALSNFFDLPWCRPLSDLTKTQKSYVQIDAGFCLMALGRLTEAAEPLQAGLKAAIKIKKWVGAAIAAGNLSELYLVLGELTKALNYARQSVDLADRSRDTFQRISMRAAWADALHQVGRLKDAEAVFCEAEELQKKHQPKDPLLYSFRGFLYCDLLLGMGEYREVQNRASETLKLATAENLLLDIALDHLSLGRAGLMQAKRENTDDFSDAVAHLDQAVDKLREAGQQDELPRGLLARAELRRVTGDAAGAETDLEEAMTIATRSGMRLHEADCHLGRAHLHLARGHKKKAQESLAKAKEMIEEMGYHRRDGEVEELEVMLSGK